MAEKSTRIDREIKAPQVRVIGMDGQQLGIMATRDALAAAEEVRLNLVEISPNVDPPVCRIMDYGKYLFEQRKQRASAQKKQKQVQIKEIKFRPVTEEGDYQVKLRNLIRFLTAGDKAKITLRFRGRELSHQELGVKLLQRLQLDIIDYGTVESSPRMEGRQMVMVISPKKK